MTISVEDRVTPIYKIVINEIFYWSDCTIIIFVRDRRSVRIARKGFEEKENDTNEKEIVGQTCLS